MSGQTAGNCVAGGGSMVRHSNGVIEIALLITIFCPAFSSIASVSKETPNINLCTDSISDLGDIAIEPDGTKVFATSSLEGRILIFSVSSGLMEASIPVVGIASGLSFSSDGKKAFVIANKNGVGNIVEISVDTDSISNVYSLGAGEFHGITLDKAAPEIFTAQSDNSRILDFNVLKGRSLSIPMGGWNIDQIIWDDTHARLYVSGDNLIEIDFKNNKFKKKIDLGENHNSFTIKPSALSINSNTSRLAILEWGFPGDVVIWDTEKESIISKINVGNGPGSVAFSQDGDRLYVTNIFPPPALSFGGGQSDQVGVGMKFLDGPGVLSSIDPIHTKLVGTSPVTVEQGSLAIAPDGDEAYVPTVGGKISVVNTQYNRIVSTLVAADGKLKSVPAINSDNAKQSSCG